jgi:DNA-binding MurR/RpiR family transcriptional regulator
MPGEPKDFMPGFKSYGEFRSALNDAEEAKEISREHKLDKPDQQREDSYEEVEDDADSKSQDDD